jgi:hypothetical protein
MYAPENYEKSLTHRKIISVHDARTLNMTLLSILHQDHRDMCDLDFQDHFSPKIFN